MVRKELATTGEIVEMTPDEVYERDIAALCGSRHTISVGTTYNANGLVPFDDYMIVYFKPEDTGGGGHIEDLLVKAVTYVTENRVSTLLLPLGIDREDFTETTLTGREIMEQKREDGEAGAVEYYTYVATHKVRITITNEYEGKTTTPYIFDLAGCNATYEEDTYCPEGEALKRFLITKPGRWTIRVQPLATAECNALNYTKEWSFDVTKPEGWEPPAIQTLTDGMSEALQEVGLPINVTPLGFVIGASLVG